MFPNSYIMSGKLNIFERESDEVYFLKSSTIDLDIIFEFLISMSKKNKRNTARVCLHKNISDPVHQMIICHQSSFKVKPHFHKSKDETCFLLKGNMEINFYDFNNKQKKSMMLSSNKLNFISIKKNEIHSMNIKRPYAIFLETTQGPFNKNDIFYPFE